jgi:hypothetical protein
MRFFLEYITFQEIPCTSRPIAPISSKSGSLHPRHAAQSINGRCRFGFMRRSGVDHVVRSKPSSAAFIKHKIKRMDLDALLILNPVVVGRGEVYGFWGTGQGAMTRNATAQGGAVLTGKRDLAVISGFSDYCGGPATHIAGPSLPPEQKPALRSELSVVIQSSTAVNAT